VTEIFNLHDTWFVAQSNWVWMLVALGLGVWVGWRSAGGETP